MGSLSRILIKGIDKDRVAELVNDYYSIGRIDVLDVGDRTLFFDHSHDAFIVYDAYVIGWTEIKADYILPGEEHDAFLMAISKNFQTTVILGYEQTTSGDTQFLVLNNGRVIRSIYQKSYDYPNRIIMECNIGDRLPAEKDFLYPEVGQDLTDYKLLLFDEIQEMFSEAGFTGEHRTDFDEKYLHLEYLRSLKNTKR